MQKIGRFAREVEFAEIQINPKYAHTLELNICGGKKYVTTGNPCYLRR